MPRPELRSYSNRLADNRRGLFTVVQAGTASVNPDFGGNGYADLVWQNQTTRQVTVNYYGGAGGACIRAGII